MMHITNKKDFVSGIVLLLVMTAFYVDSKNIDLMGGADLGPLFFPYLMMGIISLLALMLLLGSVSLRTPRPAQAACGSAPQWTRDQAVFIGLFFIYLLVLPFAGYIASTAAYLLINMLHLGKREHRWYIRYALTTAGITALVYYIFAKVMLLFLP